MTLQIQDVQIAFQPGTAVVNAYVTADDYFDGELSFRVVDALAPRPTVYVRRDHARDWVHSDDFAIPKAMLASVKSAARAALRRHR